MDNEHRKLFVIKQSKGCKFMPKMCRNTFGGRTLRSPRTPCRGGGPTSKEKEGRGLLLRGTESFKKIKRLDVF